VVRIVLGESHQLRLALLRRQLQGAHDRRRVDILGEQAVHRRQVFIPLILRLFAGSI
jgi:hypothetical protein